MGERHEPLAEVASLGAAARRYAAHIFAAAPACYPGANDSARAFFKLIGQAENPDDPDEIPGCSSWAWARFLAGWPLWRPQHLERRLFLPPAEVISHLISRCREASVEPLEPAVQVRRWNPFTRPRSTATPEELRELLRTSADLFEAMAPGHAEFLNRAAGLGQVVESAIANLPADWIPARLARAVGELADWPMEPPLEAPAFLPWLANLLESTLDRPRCIHAPPLFEKVRAEALAEMAREHLLPGEVQSSLEAFNPGSGTSAWLSLLNVLVPYASVVDSPWPRLLARLVCHAVHVIAPGFEPPIDPGTLEVDRQWFRPGRADVRYVVDEAAAGTVIRVDRFALPPARAAVSVSLGSASGSAFAVAAAWDALTGAGLDLDAFRDLLEPALEAAARKGQPIPDDLLVRVVAQLGELSEKVGKVAPAWDEFLKRVREWASGLGFIVLPEEWTFAGGGSASEPVHGLNAKVVFRRDVPPGRIAKVKAFGLLGPGGVDHTGEIVVSAGEPPLGLTELEALVEPLEGEAGEDLRGAFRALRPAGAGGFLELAAIDLFTRFWDQVQPAWSATDSEAASKFADGLNAMLRESFKLEMILPTNYRDHPAGWVFVPPGTRMISGRVVRVLRPGLASAGELRVPARVEAE